ncbi:MAG: hypothetical protein M1820_007450 [Bogoriella megaspora]|nr:MAG: hypothetical protein M1820_007450 [Bogoriella megaspora]
MLLTPEAEQSGSDSDLKGFSCLICRQRKVKCDRHVPCSNCIKAEKQCSFIPPVRGKRKRTKPPKEGLHAKLKRYEELLKSYGVPLEPPEYSNDLGSDSETDSHPGVQMAKEVQIQNRDPEDPYGLEETKPMLITKEGVSRYVDSLEHDLQHPEADGVDGAMNDLKIQESDTPPDSAEQNSLLLEDDLKIENLATLHPSVLVLSKLQEVYTDRVDPLMKILHLPTFWPLLEGVFASPQSVSKSLEANVFSFYLATISALGEDECQAMLRARKSLLFTRYRLATRQALVNAQFLSTSSLTTLQAYALFMMGVRSSYRSDTLFVLSGVAIRLARKLGLHRDGSSLGLSPFESEMRRRLWWHLVHVDFRMTDTLSLRPSMDLFSCDTKAPLNVPDEDLSPGMIVSPPERHGITSVALCLLRCDLIEFFRKFSPPFPSELRWELLTRPDFTMAKKDSLISQIEDNLERRYIRYCDPSNSLHNLVTIGIRASICRMKLFAHSPRRRADSDIKISQSERDIVFANASKLLEYNTMLPGNPSIEKYMWQFSMSYFWHTILYVLIEVRHRKTGPEVDRSWQLIGVAFSKYSQIFERSTGAVYTAIRKWTLEVWDEYVAAMRAAKMPDPSTPEYIERMREHSRPPATTESKDEIQRCSRILQDSTDDIAVQSRGFDGSFAGFDPSESYDFSSILSFEMNPNEWSQWEHLVAEEGGFS